jgi:hypothetical protein
MLKLKSLLLSILVVFLVMTSNVYAECVFGDDFEDGVINPALWVVGGSRGGVGGPGSGGGQWLNVERDGALEARVTAPISGNSYGATAWIRTVHNFNDGLDWVISLGWEGTNEGEHPWHADYHVIDITNGRTDWPMGIYTPFESGQQVLPGTTLLWVSNGMQIDGSRWHWPVEAHNPNRPWTILIDASEATASLYYGDELSKPLQWLYSKQDLDPSSPWYLRFVASGITSLDFPAKDLSIKLYDYCAIPEPATLLLLGLGGVSLLRKRRK